MPLAVQIRSGTTPSWSQANQSPVRQNPVWISSAINNTPLDEHHSASAARYPLGGTMNPPSPWIGSMITAATLDSPTCACTCDSNTSNASAAQASGPPGHRYGYAIGMR